MTIWNETYVSNSTHHNFSHVIKFIDGNIKLKS